MREPHVGRVNSVLNRQNPHGMVVTADDLRKAYEDAYMLIGDYCGGGEAAIRRELTAIVNATFRAVGVNG